MIMINLATTAQTRKMGPTKPRPKPMKQKPKPPIKVVYISNPMKVKATASQFRSLVQRLTGRDSELPDDPTGYEDGSNGRAGEADVAVGGDVSKGLDDDEVVVSTGNNNNNNNKSSVSTSTSSEGSQPVEATSSCEVGELVGGGGGARGYYGDEFLMGGDDDLFPVLGSEAFLWTWMC